MQNFKYVFFDYEPLFNPIFLVVGSINSLNFSDLIGESKLLPILESDFLMKERTLIAVHLFYYQRNALEESMFAIPYYSKY